MYLRPTPLKVCLVSVLIGMASCNAQAEYYVALPSPDVGVVWIYCSPPKKVVKYKQTVVYRTVVEKSGCQTDACEAQWRSRQPLVFYTNPPVYSESYMVYDAAEPLDINYDTGTADADW
jgi:hypothetical protein